MFRVLIRDDFVQFAKSSKAIKALVEKETKVSSRPGTPVRSRIFRIMKIHFYVHLAQKPQASHKMYCRI